MPKQSQVLLWFARERLDLAVDSTDPLKEGLLEKSDSMLDDDSTSTLKEDAEFGLASDSGAAARKIQVWWRRVRGSNEGGDGSIFHGGCAHDYTRIWRRFAKESQAS